MWAGSPLLAGARLARVVDPDALASALAQQAAGHAQRAIEHELQGAVAPASDCYRTAAALLQRAALGSPHAGASPPLPCTRAATRARCSSLARHVQLSPTASASLARPVASS